MGIRDAHEAIKAASESGDGDAMGVASSAFVRAIQEASGSVDPSVSNDVMGLLRRDRRFDLLATVTQVLIHAGQTSLHVRRQYAQALLEQGHLAAAIAVLEPLFTQAHDIDPVEHAEAGGLLGRAYKQIYVDAAGRNGTWLHGALERAVEYYHHIYAEDRTNNVWHGINAVALLCRARRDGVDIAGYPNPERIAEDIRAVVANRLEAEHDAFDIAIGAESALALGDYDAAIRWSHRFASDGQVSAFHAGSFLRQLEEVWGLDVGEPPGSQILPMLRGLLFAKDGGAELTVDSQDIHDALHRDDAGDRAKLEAVLGDVGLQSYRWWISGVQRAASVGRVVAKLGDGIGTGFLLPGSELNPTWGDGAVFVTNAHVISNDPEVDARTPDQVEVTFEAHEGSEGAPHDVTEIVRTSPPGLLDYTVARLAGVPHCTDKYPLHRRLPVADSGSRLYVIGHPKGGSLSFSFQDNELLDHDGERYLHYRTPTEPGSSGSPVFDSLWRLVALHHAGGKSVRRLNGKDGTYAANEGIWIQAVKADCA